MTDRPTKLLEQEKLNVNKLWVEHAANEVIPLPVSTSRADPHPGDPLQQYHHLRTHHQQLYAPSGLYRVPLPALQCELDRDNPGIL